MNETLAVHDPFLGQTVEVSSRLVDRLRGRYANGPTLTNGEPEFGWREFPVPPIQHEAAAEIERLRTAQRLNWRPFKPDDWWDSGSCYPCIIWDQSCHEVPLHMPCDPWTLPPDNDYSTWMCVSVKEFLETQTAPSPPR